MRFRTLSRRRLPVCVLLSCLAALVPAAWADPPPAVPLFTRDAAVRWAVQSNPELAALRQQHGIAAGAVVIAQTYPFNPVWENKTRYASGPESAGITNQVPVEEIVVLEVELRGQGRYRRQGAWAGLSRTDCEIANQEVLLAVRTLRAFDTVLYRQQKLRLVEETIRVNVEAAEQVRRLVEQARLRPGDLILARTEVDDSRAQVGLGRTSLATAQYDLRRALGVVTENVELTGSLETPAPPVDLAALIPAALEQRPDLRARQAAVAEAEARLRLTVANRFGNPSVGPVFEHDPSRVSMVGLQTIVPLPVLNTHRGEIQQAEAERARASLELRQTEVLVQQDVQAALARLKAAQAWAETYRSQVLPNLRTSLEDIQRLFVQGDPGVDVLRVQDVRRKLLKALDVYLDALLEVRQALDDLAAAVGDPALAALPCETSPGPGGPQPPRP